MADFELKVSKTFLHCEVDEESDDEGPSPSASRASRASRARRCRSSPPGDGRSPKELSFFHDEQEEQTKVYAWYASELSKRLLSKRSVEASPGSSSTMSFLPLSPTSADTTQNCEGFGLAVEVAEAVLVPSDLQLPSGGSLGHPEACRRPCIYFMQGNCENGDACVYCHLPHVEKTPKLDKRQRTIVQGLERPELLGLVHSFCLAKAEEMGFAWEAAEILQLLEEESTGARPLSESVSERDVRNLHKTLTRMNFSNLIGLVTHQSSSRAGLYPESAERLTSALERLRPRLAVRHQN